jgi:hypothetical protein
MVDGNSRLVAMVSKKFDILVTEGFGETAPAHLYLADNKGTANRADLHQEQFGARKIRLANKVDIP